MTTALWAQSARWVSWWIQRNPTYLLSAALIAVSARLYLVTPENRAGEVGVILLTLATLQAYELLVIGLLILLKRHGRSPEDSPMLLLVAAVFWTGPLAATVEMSARGTGDGGPLAILAGLIALAEMRIVRRGLGLSLSGMAQIASAASIAMLVIAPAVLKSFPAGGPEGDIVLYVCCWFVAALVLAALPAIGRHVGLNSLQERADGGRNDLHCELAFMGVVAAAACAQLAAMNYAFLGHAGPAFASPVLISAAAACTAYVCRLPGPKAWFVLPPAFIAAAIVCSMQPFGRDMPVAALPVFLRDPSAVALLLSAGVLWFGFWLTRSSGWLHAGAVLAAIGGLQYVDSHAPGLLQRFDLSAFPAPSLNLIGGWMYAVAVYLLLLAMLRRSKVHVAHAALFACVATIVVFGIGRHAPAGLMLLLAGWTWLLIVHIENRRPRIRQVLSPVIFLLVLSAADFVLQSKIGLVRLSAVALPSVLLMIGVMQRQPDYRRIAAGIFAGEAVVALAVALQAAPHPIALSASVAGFALLGGGGLISWHKHRLLACSRSAQRSLEFVREQVGKMPD